MGLRSCAAGRYAGGQGNIEHRSDAMELRRIIPSDITASAIAHVSLLTLFVLFSEVHPFGAVTAEQIPVEIVTPQELAEKQCLPSKHACRKQAGTGASATARFLPARQAAAATAPPPAAPPEPAAQPQKQAALATPRAAQPQPPSQQWHRRHRNRRRPTSRPSRMSRSSIRCCSACRPTSRRCRRLPR